MQFDTLKSSKDFKLLFEKGGKYVSPFFVIYSLPSTNNEIGFIAAKKNFKKAVERNLVKRRLKGALREVVNDVGQGMKLIVLARHTFFSAQFEDLKNNLKKALEFLAKKQ